MRLLLRFVAIVVVAGVGVAGVGFALAPQVADIVMAHDSTSSIPALSTLAERSTMYDVEGSVIQVLNAEENRELLTLDQVPPDVITTVLAVEDQDFYQHKGINGRSIIRAMFANVADGGISQGGSTITQQVVKKSILTPEQTANRKLKEAAYALRLEEELTKDQILERYLNLIYLGNGAYGLRAGAEVYFGKDVSQLTMADASLLAAIIRNPSGYDPFRFPDRARERRRVALNRLVETGALTEAQADEINASPLPAARQTTAEAPTQRSYFEEEVVQQILDDDDNTFKLGESRESRNLALFSGGLQIFTTKDQRMQGIADRAVAEQLPDSEGRFTAASATVDVPTGAVRAIVGGPGFTEAKFNLATQGRRQPGSSFKTFVLVAALEAGASITDVIDGGSPCTFPKALFGGPKDYVVRSAGGGINSLARMTASSINCAFVRLGMIVGLDNVIDVAHRMGITSELEAVPSISLGAEEVSPLDMAAAYSVLAAEGVRHPAYFIERITDRDGNLIYQHEQTNEQVIAPDIAQEATRALRSVVSGGTGRRASLGDRPAAGKTGTSQDNADAWFVGFTPQLATAVWMGAPEARISMLRLGQFSSVQGGTYPALIWQQIMEQILDGAPVMEFSEPPRGDHGAVRLYLPGAECGGQYTVEEDGSLALNTRLPTGSKAVNLPNAPINGGYALGQCGVPPPIPDELTTTTTEVPAVDPNATTTVPVTPPTSAATPTTPPSATVPTTTAPTTTPAPTTPTTATPPTTPTTPATTPSTVASVGATTTGA